MRLSIPLKVLLKEEARYFIMVTRKVRTHRKSLKAHPDDLRVVDYRSGRSNKFWSDMKGENKNNLPYVAELQGRMESRRRNQKVSTQRSMDIPKDGVLKYLNRYNKRTPVPLGESERVPKKLRVCESVWDVHRSLCPKIPFFAMEDCSNEVGDALEIVAEKVRAHIKKYQIKPKKDSAHNGYSFATRVAGGGKYSNVDESLSGSVHWSQDFAKDPSLQRELIGALCDCIISAYGKCHWFLSLNEFLRNNSDPCFADRLLPGLPVTHIWLSVGVTPYNFHRDVKNFGVGFLLVPFDVEGADLVITDPDVDIAKSFHVKKYTVIAGRCFQCYHCNEPLKDPSSYRESYALYFDYRVGSSRYIRMDNMYQIR